MQNGLIDPVTLTFGLLTSEAYHFHPKIIPIPSLKTLGSFVAELCCGQADNKQTNRQTVKHTDSKILLTPADIVGIGNENVYS